MQKLERITPELNELITTSEKSFIQQMEQLEEKIRLFEEQNNVPKEAVSFFRGQLEAYRKIFDNYYLIKK